MNVVMELLDEDDACWRQTGMVTDARPVRAAAFVKPWAHPPVLVLAGAADASSPWPQRWSLLTHADPHVPTVTGSEPASTL